MRKRLWIAVALIGSAISAGAQAPDRTATTTDALLANSLFFSGKRVVVRHAVKQTDDLAEFEATAKPIFIFFRDPPSGSQGEVRGEFWDLGRIQDGDSRFSSYDFSRMLATANNGRWPGRDQIFVMIGATFVPGPPPSAPTIRSISLLPEQFDGRTVTVVGRLRGRNLFADLPQAVSRGKWDFVLQSADASIWVTDLRPKGKDFDLDPGARVDTGRWLEVTGTVRRDGTAVWVAGESVRLATPPAETAVEVSAPAVPREAAPTVIFSAPLADEPDVPVDGRIRIQFSRDMTPGSFKGRVHVRYGEPPAAEMDASMFTATYNDATRALEIRFKDPLDRGKVVSVQLDPAITAIDGQPLQPWTLKFTTGQ